MRTILAMLMLTIWIPGVEAADEPDAARYLGDLEKAPRLRLAVHDAASLRWDVKPAVGMVTVGRLDTLPAPGTPLPASDPSRWQNGLRFAKADDPLSNLATGVTKFLPPRAGGSNGLFLVGPELNSGEAWGPVALTRSGNTLTLLVESWTDNGGRRRNIISRESYFLSLPGLEEGKYELRFVWRGLFRDASKQREHYAWNTTRAGRIDFTVEKKDAEPTAGKVSSLADADLKLFEPAAADRGRLWQRGSNWFRPLAMGKDLNGLPAPGLFVGALDFPAWLQTNPATLSDLPRLAIPEATSSLHAVVLGPPLSTGETMTLREVEWKDKDAIVRVEVWSDDSPRLKNIPFWPLLVVPLSPPTKVEANRSRLVPGDYTVRVEWSFRRAPGTGGLYGLPDPTKGPAGAAKDLKEKSEQKFTIR